MGALLVLNVIVGCIATADDMKPDDQESLDRQSRGILLRSWRSVQQLDQQKQPLLQQKLNKASWDKGEAASLLSPGPMHRETAGSLLAGLPVSMKLVLLQRLTGHDKRAPNSKAFLGMRGKKDINSWSDDDRYDQDDQDEWEDASRYKKRASAKERDLIQQYIDQIGGIKRAPSTNSFLGMRGKRSGGWMIHKDDYAKEDTDTTGSSDWAVEGPVFPTNGKNKTKKPFSRDVAWLLNSNNFKYYRLKTDVTGGWWCNL